MSGRPTCADQWGCLLRRGFPARWVVAAGGQVDAEASARGQRETGRPDRNVCVRRLFCADVLRRCAICDTERSGRALPRHDRPAGRWNGDHHQAAAPHRVSFLHRDRDAVRDRCGIAGHRGRRPVELPLERSQDQAVGVHPQHRGDRRLRARPRGGGGRPRRPGARHAGAQSPDPHRACGQGPGRLVSADPAARSGRRSPVRGGLARREDAIEGRLLRRLRLQAGSSVARVPRAGQHLLLGDLGHLHRAGVQAARTDQHRRCRDLSHLRLSAAVGRVHRGVESRPHRAGRHEVLPAGSAHGRCAAWLERDRRGQNGPGDRGRRRHRKAA